MGDVRKKQVLTGMLALIVILTVFGCSKPGEGVKSKSENRDIILATTTSTRDSGLLDVLIPVFEQQTGYRVKTIAVGTGQALAMGERGEADVLLAHSPAAEKKLVESGAVISRHLVMYNDFILVGPPDDPAGVSKEISVSRAFAQIAAGRRLFVSRGDDSGTHKKEMEIWQSTGIKPAGSWYQETGSGMGQTLNVAAEKGGYTLTDRATYLALEKNLGLAVMVEGEGLLLNPYHVMGVNPAMFTRVNGIGGRALIEFLLSAEAQEVIAGYDVEKYGQPLFFAGAGRTEDDLLQ